MSNEIKTRPTAGYGYKVKSGDRITFISNTAYGTSSKTGLIVNANPILNGRPISLENLPTIYPGDVLFIPEIIEKKKTLIGKNKNEFTLILGNREIPVEAAKLLRTMDTAADACNVSIAWIPGLDKDLDKLTAPYSFTDAEIYLGNELMLTGRLYNVSQTQDSTGIKKELEIFSTTADIIDSCVSPPYEKNNISLFERAKQLCEPLGIFIDSDLDSDGGKFKRMTADTGQKIFEHLLKYAKQRSILISSTTTGKLFFTRANVDGKSVGTIIHEVPLSEQYSARFDGRNLYHLYRAIGQNAKKFSKKEAIAKDDIVPRSRQLTFEANDNTEGNIKDTASWQRSKQIIEALTIPMPIKRPLQNNWYGPDGNLWRENTIVTVKSDVLGIPNGFDFLITQVEYDYTSSGTTTNLSIVPPNAYTGKDLVLPWSTI